MSLTIHERACGIVQGILDDLRSRSGLQNEWDAIDTDTQEEIKSTWVDIATREIAK